MTSFWFLYCFVDFEHKHLVLVFLLLTFNMYLLAGEFESPCSHLNIFIDEKNYKDLIIYLTRYDRGKSIRISSLYYYELLGKTEEYEGKNIL